MIKKKVSSAMGIICFGIMLVYGLFPIITMAVANKIVIVTADSEHLQALKHGFVTAMGLQFNATTTTKSYSLDSGYIIEFESDTSKIDSTLKRTDVIAVVCSISTVCIHASLDKNAPNDVLVVATLATSSELKQVSNLLRLAPNNELQAKLIYDELSQDLGSEQRFAIVYEPDAYAMDFYNMFLSQYFIDVVFEYPKPIFAASIPFHSFLFNVSEEHKSINADIALKTLRQLQVDAVLYFGYNDGFATLTDPELGGDPTIAKRWYAIDGVTMPKGFANLKVYNLYIPNSQEDISQNYYGYDTGKFLNKVNYYYGYDAGKFLDKVIANYQPQNTNNREEFLQVARETVLAEKDSLTGEKSFAMADSIGRFITKTFDDQGNFEINDVTVRGAFE